MTELGLYLHIPFCKSKCSYCDFYSLPHREQEMDAYTAALCRELIGGAFRCDNAVVDTVYFGGGTPSYLGSERLSRILATVKEHYRLLPAAEITVEANPDSAGEVAPLAQLRQAGCNRISLGVQSTDDALLKRIGRIHTYAQVKQAVWAARQAGFENLSIDLIYGLPEQSLTRWQQTLQEAVELQAQHISVYGLKVEEGTPLWREKDTAGVAGDDLQADMYLWAVEFLRQQGYGQYEISNFARPGFESRHNLKYWQLKPYLGFGPGAHSDFGGERFARERDLERYINGTAGDSERTAISLQERQMEYIMLSLRTTRGLEAEPLRQYGVDIGALEPLMKQCQSHGLAAQTQTGWRLTPKGFLVSNAIIGQAQDAIG